ncbi:MAG: ATP-binding protein [Candidatus Heimdallarchaeota archaeon]|nr:ATP-binding protein [Candidatus Heimdallarchaeota archaeon]
MAFLFQSFEFPDEGRYEKTILNHKINPFPEPPASSNLENRPALFMVGRQEQIDKLNELFESVLQSGDSKLAMIQGSQGVGKSTLASHFIIRKQKENNKIYLVPFETSGSKGNLNFSTFFGIMMSSFLKQEVLYEVTYNIVAKILQLYIENCSQSFDGILNKLQLSKDDYLQIQKEPKYLKEIDSRISDSKFLVRFIDVFGERFNEIYNFLPSKEAEIYLVLLNVVFKSSEVFNAQRAIKGTGEFQGFDIRNEITAKNVFKEFIELIKWINPQAVLMLVIDHLEAGLSNAEEVYNELFSLLLEFRQIKHILIILSGTFDAYLSIQENIREDRYRQVENWSFKNNIGLKPLPSEEVQMIIQYHLNKIWSKDNLTTPSKYPLYPYTKESVSYIYSYFHKDVRHLLEQFYYHFQEMIENSIVTPIWSVFDAIKKFRDHNKFVINRDEIEIFKGMLLDKRIQDKERSSKLEMALIDIFKIVADNTKLITNVKHEPKMGKKGLKPDIYFEVGDSLEKTRRVACEVKLYRTLKEIPAKEVKKTHSLLTSNEIDYLIWISNKPLNNSKYSLSEGLHSRVGRSSELNDREIAYCSLLVFKEQLWDLSEITVDRAKQLLVNAGIDIDNHVQGALTLSKNSVIPLDQQVDNSTLLDFFDEKEKTNDEIVLDDDEDDSDQMDDVYREKITKFIESKSQQQTMGINTVLKNMKKQEYDLEEIMRKDEAVIYIQEIAKSMGFKANATKILFRD